MNHTGIQAADSNDAARFYLNLKPCERSPLLDFLHYLRIKSLTQKYYASLIF